jgi:hypothetical protein
LGERDVAVRGCPIGAGKIFFRKTPKAITYILFREKGPRSDSPAFVAVRLIQAAIDQFRDGAVEQRNVEPLAKQAPVNNSVVPMSAERLS